jgi:hypothetical protein
MTMRYKIAVQANIRMNGRMKMKRIGILLLAACLMVAISGGAASAITLFISGTDELCNNDSTVWDDAFSDTIRVTVFNNQCLEMRFSTEAGVIAGLTPDVPQIQFQALVDGINAHPVNPIFFDAADFGSYDSMSFNWFICGLNKGRHTVRIQYRPANAGDTACVRAGALIMELDSGKFVL